MSLKEVDFFQHPRYSMNKFLLSCNGQWPYQKKSQRILLLSTTLMFTFTTMPAQFAKIIVDRHDVSMMLLSFGPLFVHILCVIKVVNSSVCSDTMRRLLERIRADWDAHMGAEKEILARYADGGRMFTVTYTVWIYFSTVTYLISSVIPYIMVVNGSVNLSLSSAFAIPVYYTAHDENYYVYIEIFLSMGIVVLISALIAVDGMFVVFVQHACGIFSAIGYRLENIVVSEDLDIDFHPRIDTDKTFWIITDCIRRHNMAIEFVELINSAYSQSFLFLLGLNMLSITFTGYQLVLWGINPEAVHESIKQGLFIVAEVLHLFFESLFSQKLTDHSLEIYNSLNKSKWYQTSFRTRQLIYFMLMKSMIPWELKAGNIYTMSMKNFSDVLRTSLSYLTILRSME